MLAAMTTGHDGSLSTVHAGSPAEALRRVETLALMADVDLPLAAIREQIADALDLIVHQARLPDGRRQVTAVTEVVRDRGRPCHARHLHLHHRSAALARRAVRGARVPAGGRMTRQSRAAVSIVMRSAA